MTRSNELSDGLTGPGEAATSGRSRPWWRGGYVRVLSASAVSAVGDRVSYVVLPFTLLAVGVPAGGVAVVLGARAVGYALAVLYGGVLADRVSRRRLMVASDLTCFLTQAVTAGLVFAGEQGVASLVCLQFVYGLGSALFGPAAAGLVPEVVPDEFLERANGYLGTSANVGMILGPVVGGILTAAGLAGVGLAFDSLSFLISAVLLVGIRRPERVEPPSRQSLVADFLQGWWALLGQRWLLMVIMASSVFELLSLASVFSLGPALADQSLGGAEVWGVLVATFGVGGVVGGLVAGRIAASRPIVLCAVLLAVLSAQPLNLASGLPVPAIGVLQFCAGASLTIYLALSGSTLQRMVPREVLSRVSSFQMLTTTSLLPVGYLIAGGLSGLVGVPAAMRILAGVAVISCLAIVLSPSVRSVRRKQMTNDV